ncbi:MAG: hypothetical protein AAF609_13830 [Cyanobacteria bacterium P01_C01_bin.120]
MSRSWNLAGAVQHSEDRRLSVMSRAKLKISHHAATRALQADFSMGANSRSPQLMPANSFQDP